MNAYRVALEGEQEKFVSESLNWSTSSRLKTALLTLSRKRFPLS